MLNCIKKTNQIIATKVKDWLQSKNRATYRQNLVNFCQEALPSIVFVVVLLGTIALAFSALKTHSDVLYTSGASALLISVTITIVAAFIGLYCAMVTHICAKKL